MKDYSPVFIIVGFLFAAWFWFLYSNRDQKLREANGSIRAKDMSLEGADREITELKEQLMSLKAAQPVMAGANIPVVPPLPVGLLPEDGVTEIEIARLQEIEARLQETQTYLAQTEQRLQDAFAERNALRAELTETQEALLKETAQSGDSRAARAAAEAARAGAEAAIEQARGSSARKSEETQHLYTEIARLQGEVRKSELETSQLRAELDAIAAAPAPGDASIPPPLPNLVPTPAAMEPVVLLAEVDTVAHAEAAAALIDQLFDLRRKVTELSDALTTAEQVTTSREARVQELEQANEQLKVKLATPPPPPPVAATVPTPIAPVGIMPVGPLTYDPDMVNSPDDERQTVLIIDNDQTDADLLTLYFQSAGYSVVVGRTGAEALAYARSLKPIAITLDVRLPDTDGWEALGALKGDAETRDIPVLMTTPKKDKDKALSLGASNTLSKPIDRSILLSSLKSALMTRKRRENRSLVAKGIALAAGVSAEDTSE